MKIVVTTPTGNVGKRVTKLLVQAGVRPVALARDARRLEDGVREHVDAVEGDQRDRDYVLRATEGAAALYWVSPPTGDEDPVEAHERMGEVAAQAIREHGIDRTVFQSSVGAEKRSGAGEIDGLAAIELALDETGASVTHLRCGFFFTNLLLDPQALENGVLYVTRPPDAPMPWVDPRDIGEVAAARLLSTEWSGRQVQAVHGPRDLSYATGLREGFTPQNPRTALTTTPTTLGAWAHEHLRDQPV
jgi:NAD(P)H dehydrogenase (quinone)